MENYCFGGYWYLVERLLIWPVSVSDGDGLIPRCYQAFPFLGFFVAVPWFDDDGRLSFDCEYWVVFVWPVDVAVEVAGDL